MLDIDNLDANVKDALCKVYEARRSLVEAYELWPTAEIRRCRERIDEALDELLDLRQRRPF